MLCIPLTTTPIGWFILGAGGYALYKAGKKRGVQESGPGDTHNHNKSKPESFETKGETK